MPGVRFPGREDDDTQEPEMVQAAFRGIEETHTIEKWDRLPVDSEQAAVRAG